MIDSYRKLITSMAVLPMLAFGQVEHMAPCGPVPTEDQLRWQDMEMYAFIHYSLNTYTDQEWGFGNEALELFNPSDLDCRHKTQYDTYIMRYDASFMGSIWDRN